MTSKTTQQVGARVSAQTVPSRVVNWRSSTGEPEVLTLTLLPIVQPGTTEPRQFDSLNPFRADLTWGYGPVSSTATIDYPVMGSTVTITASSLTVDVRPDGFATLGPGIVTDPGTQIGAFVARGASRPDATPPTFTRVNDNVVFTPSGGIIGLPAFARAYYIEDSNDPSAVGADQITWQIQCQNRGSPNAAPPGVLTNIQRRDTQLIVAATDQRLGPAQPTPFALPARCTHLEIARGVGYAAPAVVTAVFILDLGA